MDNRVLHVAKAIHEARIGLCWGKNCVGVREPWPDFSDPVVKRAYPHSPIAYVDVSIAEAKAAIEAIHTAPPPSFEEESIRLQGVLAANATARY